MKKIILSFIGAGWILFAAGQYKIAGNKSSVKFNIKNLGFNVGGTFQGLEGTVSFDPKRPLEAMFKVSVDAGTVNTDNEMRDSHLKKESYFNVQQYPRISFESTKITNSTKKGVLFVFGTLTIKNHSKEISFPFTAEPAGDGYLFKGSFTINRKDFDVGGASIISDNAEVSLSVFAGN